MMNNIEVLILAGGKGTRLATVINNVPKPMAPIQGQPFLEVLINAIRTQGFSKFRLLVGYKAEVIQNHFGDGSRFGVDIEYTYEDTPLGTGGAVKKAIQESSANSFLIFNGDTLFEADLSRFIQGSRNQFSLALRYLDDCTRYGQVALDKKNKVVSFIEKGASLKAGYVNAGIYNVSREILKYFPDKMVISMEQDVLPILANTGQLLGVPLEGKFIDIGIPEDFARAQTFLKEFRFNAVKNNIQPLVTVQKLNYFWRHYLEKMNILLRSLPRKILLPVAAHMYGICGTHVPKVKRQKPHLLILRNKYYSRESRQISTEEYHLDNTLKDSDLATFEVVYYDNLKLSPISDFQFISKCKTIRPDAVLLSSWWESFPNHPSLKSIQFVREKLDIRIATIWWDTCSESFGKALDPIMSAFDTHIIVDNPKLHFINKDNPFFLRIISLWPPEDHKLFYFQEGIKKFPLSFLGQASSYRSYRKKVLEYLVKNNIPGHFSTHDRNEQVSHQEYARIMRESQISLNFSQSVNGNQLKSRVMEIFFSGALLFETENEQIAELFTPMKDFVPFKSKEDLIEKLSYYWNHPSELKSIADHGHKTAMEKYHSNRFWEAVLKKLQLI